MTTITTGTTGPRAWKIAMVAAVVGLAALIVVSLPSTTSETTSQPATEETNAALPEAIRGFEYENQSTRGRVVSAGVTTQYFGDNGGVYPDENGPLIRTVSDQAEINLLVPSITQEFIDGSSSADQGENRVDPRAADELLVNPVPESSVAELIEQFRASERATPQDSVGTVETGSLAAADELLVNPVPESSVAELIEQFRASERATP